MSVNECPAREGELGRISLDGVRGAVAVGSHPLVHTIAVDAHPHDGRSAVSLKGDLPSHYACARGEGADGSTAVGKPRNRRAKAIDTIPASAA